MKKKIKNMFKKICILSLVAALSFTTVFSVSSIKTEAFGVVDALVLAYNVLVKWFDDSNKAVAGDPIDFNQAVNITVPTAPLIYNQNPSSVPYSLVNTSLKTIFDPILKQYVPYSSVTQGDDGSYTFHNDNYDYSVTNNTTHVSYVITSNIDPSKKAYIDKYYELPDGRNSYNLTPRDIEGVIFNYDVINYERTNMTDKVLGIWHLDGNFHNELMQDDTSQHFNAHYSQSWSAGYFEGGAQLTKYLPQDYFALYANQAVGSGWWTLDFKAYFPSSGKTSLVDNGNGLKYYPFNPFAFLENTSAFGGYFKISPDTWHEISLVHRPDNGFVMYMDGYLCGTFTEGANKIFGTANDNFIIYDTNSNEIVFQSIATEQYTSLGNGDYGFEVLGQGFIIDEVRLSKGNIYEASEFFHYPSSMPYDSTFAYTIPDNLNYISSFIKLDSSYYILPSNLNSRITLYSSLVSNPNSPNFKYFPFKLKNSSGNFYWFSHTIPDIPVNDGNQIYKIEFYNKPSSNSLFCSIYDSNGSFIGEYNKGNQFVEDLYIVVEPSFSYDNINFCYSYIPVYTPQNVIAIQSVFDVNSYQIGGVRKSSPVSGDVFIPYEDGKAGKAQQYFYGKWNEVNSGVFFNGKWYDITSFDFTSMMIAVDPNEYNSTNIPGGGNVVYPGTNGGSGTGGGTVINMQPVLDILNKWYGDWSVPNIEIPETLGDGFHWYDLLIFFLYFIYLFNILLRLLEIVGYGLAYAFSIISIPASSQFLNENIVTAFKYLHGETFAIVGDTGPVQVVPFVLQIGSFSLSLFDFMVLLTQLAFIAVFIRFFHTFTDYFDISKRG